MEQQIDVTSIVQSGVYLLSKNGRVVFIGRAKCLLEAIHGHRAAAYGPRLPEWFPIKGVRFDSVEIIPATYERAMLIALALVKYHKCATNLDMPGIPGSITITAHHHSIPIIERRI